MAAHHTSPSPLIEPDAADYIGYTPSALRLWRREGRGPAYIRHNRSIRYLAHDLDEWLARHRVHTRDTRDHAPTEAA